MDLQSIASNYGPLIGAIGGLVTALTIFVLAEVLWKPRLASGQFRKELLLRRLNLLYAPLYQYYLEAYARFDEWEQSNPSTVLGRQAFFDDTEGDVVAQQLFADQAGLASQDLLRAWTGLRIATKEAERNRWRALMASTVTREFNQLRRELGLDYSPRELATGDLSLTDREATAPKSAERASKLADPRDRLFNGEP